MCASGGEGYGRSPADTTRRTCDQRRLTFQVCHFVTCSSLFLRSFVENAGYRRLRKDCGVVGGELLIRAGFAPEDGLDVVTHPLGVALSGQTERLGVLLGDHFRQTSTDHCALVFFEAEFAVSNGPTEQL